VKRRREAVGTGASRVCELSVSVLSLLLMVGSFWGGLTVQRFLRDVHRSRESVESVRVVITLLVTFAALVLGLLISSSQGRFSAREANLRGLSIDITELDQRLRDYLAIIPSFLHHRVASLH
jgi:hypothetical protein